MLRRFLTLGLAVVFAVFGTGVVVVYAHTDDGLPLAAPPPAVVSRVVPAAPAPSATPVAAFAVPADKLAVSLELTLAQRVGGHLRSGSEVAVFSTGPAAGAGAKPAAQVTRLLLPRVPVLAVGTSKADARTAVITFAVAPADVERLIHGARGGTLQLALLGSAAEVSPGPGVDGGTLFPQPVEVAR